MPGSSFRPIGRWIFSQTGRILLAGGIACAPLAARAGEPSSGLSINGSALPGFRPALPAAGFAAGAPGLPDAAAAIERLPPGAHGVPPVGPDAGSQAAAPGLPPNGWSEAEVRAAQVQCQRTLAGLDAQFIFVPQVKSGPCGTPAAIELSGFGNGLAISPPIVVSCDIAASLQTWMKAHVQPLAKRHLGTSVIQINTMSSYACRNRYGARNAPLSQHAFANAVDIRGFVTAKGQLLDVEQHWGPTMKELAAYQAALPTVAAFVTPAAQQTAPSVAQGAIRAATLPAMAPPIHTAVLPSATARDAPAGRSAKGWATTLATGPAIMPAAVGTAGHAAPPIRIANHQAGDQLASTALRLSFPVVIKANAGEPSTIKIVASGQTAMMGAAPVPPGQPLDARAHFLREIWQAACGPFTTVLGPEANRAHRNHFHIDLAQRKSGAFCQ